MCNQTCTRTLGRLVSRPVGSASHIGSKPAQQHLHRNSWSKPISSWPQMKNTPTPKLSMLSFFLPKEILSTTRHKKTRALISIERILVCSPGGWGQRPQHSPKRPILPTKLLLIHSHCMGLKNDSCASAKNRQNGKKGEKNTNPAFCGWIFSLECFWQIYLWSRWGEPISTGRILWWLGIRLCDEENFFQLIIISFFFFYISIAKMQGT